MRLMVCIIVTLLLSGALTACITINHIVETTVTDSNFYLNLQGVGHDLPRDQVEGNDR